MLWTLIKKLATGYGLIAPIVIIDCMTRFSSPVYAMIHGTPDMLPPDDPSGMSSTHTLLWIFAATLIGVVFCLLIARAIAWLILAKTGWFGRSFGESVILGILRVTGTKGKNWKRDWIVRTIFKDISGKKLKSLSVIQKRCRHGEPFRVGKAANDNRKPRKQRKAA